MKKIRGRWYLTAGEMVLFVLIVSLLLGMVITAILRDRYPEFFEPPRRPPVSAPARTLSAKAPGLRAFRYENSKKSDIVIHIPLVTLH